jgi:hypothetical protein
VTPAEREILLKAAEIVAGAEKGKLPRHIVHYLRWLAAKMDKPK